MLARTVSELLIQLGHRWKLTNDMVIAPTDNDVERFFDEAAKHLHTEEVGARLTSANLIIEKKANNSHGVYVYVGEYK